MKRIIPDDIYRDKPCSVVAVGCALGVSDADTLANIKPVGMHRDGYLSLKNMETMILSSGLKIRAKKYLNRHERAPLREVARHYKGEKCIICVLGHFVYFDGRDYHSFFFNGGDDVCQIWTLEG